MGQDAFLLWLGAVNEGGFVIYVINLLILGCTAPAKIF